MAAVTRRAGIFAVHQNRLKKGAASPIITLS